MWNQIRFIRPLFLPFIFILGLWVLGSGCEKELDLSGITPKTTTTSGPVGKIVETSFFVSAITDTGVDSYFHEQSTILPSTCKVLPSESILLNRDIKCILDIPELDLYYYGYTLNYNAPTSMCSYVEIQGYDYFIDTIGLGPSTMTLCKDSVSKKVLASSQLPVAGPAIPPAIYRTAGVTSDADGKLSCEFDHTGGVAGVNCCEGKYTLIEELNDVGACGTLGNTKTTLGIYDWPGKIGNCVDGPGTYLPDTPDSKGVISKNGFPFDAYMHDTGNLGINGVWKTKAPIKLGKATNLFTANYYAPLAGAKPAAYHQPFAFICRDPAFEIIARIKVYVRSWDNMVGFLAHTTDYSAPAVEAQYLENVHDLGVWQDFSALAYPLNFPYPSLGAD